MTGSNTKKHTLVRLKAYYLLCASLILLDFLPIAHIGPKGWDIPWGFFGIFGFVACIALVIAAKGLRKLAMRDERFYSDDISEDGP